MEERIQYRAYSIRLRHGAREAYIRQHQNVWEEVEQTMRAAGVVEYRIFLTEDDQLFSLIGFREGCDMATLVERNKQVEACRQWDSLMAPMQERQPFAKGQEWWAELPQIYHLEKEV